MRPPTASNWLLVAIAAVLASLVGLVASGGERVPDEREPAPAEPWVPARTRVALVAPSTSSAIEHEPPASVPAQVSRPAAPTRDARDRLTGVVLYPEGEPAAGARVVLGKQRATCDALGRFELVLPADSTGADLLAFASGHEPALQPAFGPPPGVGAEHTVRLVLGPETLTLSGVVVGAENQPLKGWTVELDGPDVLADFGLRDVVRSDANGSFVLTDVPAGVRVVRAWKERRELAFRSSPTSAGESGIVIVTNE